MKIAVAMSGGVDSSVAAGLMVKEYGKENVFGVTMRLFCYGEAEVDEKSCCSMDAVNDAKTVCNQLGIAHYTVNMEKEFEEAVILDFVSEYQKGRTPIPCIPCNTLIKFDYLLKKVKKLGAEKIITGHYAQIKETEGVYHLSKGVDETKDQTYFLYRLSQEQLAQTLFPLGDKKKTEVRKMAAEMNLKTAQKTESQGICFVTEGRVTDYLRGKVKIKPGEIINTKGEVVGGHEGVIFYTVGQRKRIGGGYSEPMYVVRIIPEKNQVVIGTKDELFEKEVIVEKPHWIGKEIESLEVQAKIRYNMEEEECRIEKIGENIKLVFKKPQRAVTPGQSAVIYQDDEVLGGGIISK